MITYETKVKSWGNSMGVVLPKKVFEKDLAVGKKVRISVSPVKELKAGDLFGAIPGIADNIEKDLKEIDKEFDDLE
jgi:antitoxin component of MazEF toxin-antitoxin module